MDSLAEFRVRWGIFKGRAPVFGWTLALVLMTASGTLAAPDPATGAAAPLPAATTAPKADVPLTLADFIAEPTLSMARLSPSGKSIALVRRVKDIDQVLRVDLPGMTSAVIYQTRHVPAYLAKDDYRESVTYLAWKSNDKLMMTVTTPVKFFFGNLAETLEAPVHSVLNADGKSAPYLLNEKVHGKTADVELSWIQSVLTKDPDHILIGVRKSAYEIDVYKMSISDGSRVLVETGGNDVIGYENDKDGNLVARTVRNGDHAFTLEARQPGEKAWTKVFDFHAKQQRELSKYEFLGTGEVGSLYIGVKPETAADGDTEVVRTYNLKTQTMGPVLWSNPHYDVFSIIKEEDTEKFLGGCYWADTLQCDFKSARLTSNFKGLGTFFQNKRSVVLVSQSDDDQTWIVYASGPDDPGSYYVYDVARHDLQFLGAQFPALTPQKLGPSRRMEFKARDGAALFAYVTTPPGTPAVPAPLIVMPHGGPEARDHYEFDLWVQHLAAQGYVVLQPNFRGSGGFGKTFADAGYRQWGGRMHDDVMDATRALIAEGKIDPGRVCIVGGSYGGYEALYSAATEPATFRCAVSMAGPSDLPGNLKWERTFGKDSVRYAYWLKSMGDPATDQAVLATHSPYRLAANWRTPLLLVHGTADPIVPVEESRQMKRALEGAGKPVQYLEVEDMGHGPSTDKEKTKVFTAMDQFLATYLQPQKATVQADLGKPIH